MWPWIKRWRDWAMTDLWSMHRIGPQPQALHYSYEKAGLTLHDQPIPWNAEAVLVETLVRLHEGTPRRRADYELHVPGQEPVAAESLHREQGEHRYRLFFRLRPPAQTTTAHLVYRGHL